MAGTSLPSMIMSLRSEESPEGAMVAEDCMFSPRGFGWGCAPLIGECLSRPESFHGRGRQPNIAFPTLAVGEHRTAFGEEGLHAFPVVAASGSLEWELNGLFVGLGRSVRDLF